MGTLLVPEMLFYRRYFVHVQYEYIIIIPVILNTTTTNKISIIVH